MDGDGSESNGGKENEGESDGGGSSGGAHIKKYSINNLLLQPASNLDPTLAKMSQHCHMWHCAKNHLWLSRIVTLSRVFQCLCSTLMLAGPFD